MIWSAGELGHEFTELWDAGYRQGLTDARLGIFVTRYRTSRTDFACGYRYGHADVKSDD